MPNESESPGHYDSKKITEQKSGASQQKVRQDFMGVSKNKGTPKWMVYNGKPY